MSERLMGLSVKHVIPRSRFDHCLTCTRLSFDSGKTAMDVGCGTGLLAMMMARAGAAVVHAVEVCEGRGRVLPLQRLALHICEIDSV